MLGPWVRTPPSLHSLNGIMLIQVHINKTEASDKWILSGGKKDEMVLVFSSAYRESNLIFFGHGTDTRWFPLVWMETHLFNKACLF